MSKETVVETLELYAEFLEIDGQDNRAHAYGKAARAVQQSRRIPPNPARLDNVGASTRDTIINVENGEGIEELSRLREQYPWYDEFHEIQYVGPERAQKIVDALGIETLDRLKLAAKEGDLQLVSGIGPKTESVIRSSIKNVASDNE